MTLCTGADVSKKNNARELPYIQCSCGEDGVLDCKVNTFLAVLSIVNPVPEDEVAAGATYMRRFEKVLATECLWQAKASEISEAVILELGRMSEIIILTWPREVNVLAFVYGDRNTVMRCSKDWLLNLDNIQTNFPITSPLVKAKFIKGKQRGCLIDE